MPTLTNDDLLYVEGAESKSVFQDQREYEAFCREFYEKVKPDLDANAEARRRREEEAARRWIR